MHIREFQIAVNRTLPDLGSLLLNSIHCTLGVGSELNEEVVAALRSGDKVNLGEEFADAEWYLSNDATIYGLILPEQIIFIDPLETSDDDKKAFYDNLQIYTGKLQDMDKRELVYGKVADRAVKIHNILMLLGAIEFVASDNGINMNEYREKNVKKLLLRYPIEEGFTQERAINRDTTAERVILEEVAA